MLEGGADMKYPYWVIVGVLVLFANCASAYSDRQYKFNIEFPQNWKVYHEDVDGGRVTVASDPDSKSLIKVRTLKGSFNPRLLTGKNKFTKVMYKSVNGLASAMCKVVAPAEQDIQRFPRFNALRYIYGCEDQSIIVVMLTLSPDTSYVVTYHGYYAEDLPREAEAAINSFRIY
jgi:hypothetical protein